MPVESTENVSVFIPLILRGKVSGSGEDQVDLELTPCLVGVVLVGVS